ncbi:MAG: T9SS type A sorting domain-containing protein [Ignavibacteriae bacterium]|nr:T9SS type A sorting domain-containing protein [Ignavibacteriota bacterium]
MKSNLLSLTLFVLTNALFAQTPPTPTNVTALVIPGTHELVRVTWNLPQGPWFCDVYRSVDDSLHFFKVWTSTQRSFDDPSVHSGRTYFYFVKAVAGNDTNLVESGRSNVARVVVSPPSTGVRGTIQGTVVDDSTNLPLRGVRIRFFKYNLNSTYIFDITDSLGRYEAEMDSGRYLVKAEPPQEGSAIKYRPEWYDNAPEPSIATRIVVGNGTLSTANFGLRRMLNLRFSHIEGTVTNAQGQPISNAMVAVMRSIQEMNYLAATTGRTPGLGQEQLVLPAIGFTRGVIWKGFTDNQGRYRASVPSNGSYIAASGKGGFYLQYFDRTTDPTQATIIVAAEDTAGVNFFLRPYSSSNNSIQGVIRDSTGLNVPSRVILFPRPPHGSPPSQSVHSDGDGTYEFTHVDAGTYTVLAVPFSNYALGFYKDGGYGISQWQLADSVTVTNSVGGIAVGVVPIQSNGLTQVSGVSVMSNGTPLAGGRVIIKNSLGTVLGSGVSTSAGYYSVDAVPTGSVTLVVDKEPYPSQELNVYIPSNTYFYPNINFVFAPTTTAIGSPNGLPETMSLEQNYPNPFNPGTIIRFNVPGSGVVSLKVFDLLGREVSTLVNEVMQPGAHVMQFDASKLSSGVYFYQLSSGSLSVRKKMIIAK